MKPIESFSGEYRFLSNFWRAPTEYDGEVYPTSEHAYQAAKTLNHQERQAVKEMPTPGTAKVYGTQVTLRSDWETIKLDVMEQVLLSKFSRSQGLRAKLLATGDAELIEGNKWGDTFWGVCKGVGQNQLGKILMKVRATLDEPEEQCGQCGALVEGHHACQGVPGEE